MQKCCLQFIVANSIFVDKIPKMHCGLKEPSWDFDLTGNQHSESGTSSFVREGYYLFNSPVCHPLLN